MVGWHPAGGQSSHRQAVGIRWEAPGLPLTGQAGKGRALAIGARKELSEKSQGQRRALPVGRRVVGLSAVDRPRGLRAGDVGRRERECAGSGELAELAELAAEESDRGALGRICFCPIFAFPLSLDRARR